MRTFLIAASTVAALAAIPTVASAQYVDYGYGQPGPVYVNPPPAVYPAPPMAQSQVYLAPGSTVVAPAQPYVAPGTSFNDDAVYVGGARYYRDCYWDWGQRRCELKPWR